MINKLTFFIFIDFAITLMGNSESHLSELKKILKAGTGQMHRINT